jgi:hypothetical protein
MTKECVPALNRDGSYSKGGNAYSKMYKALEQREGPRPLPKTICRHLCKNDTTTPNGFVCTLHTTWGTYSENAMDKSPENRAKGGKHRSPNGGKISGRINVESGHLASIASKGRNSPHHANKLQVTCPYCGKTGQKVAMAQWHFDRCKLKQSN